MKNTSLFSKFGASKSKHGGFTLIEILVVIGIIAILAAIVIIAINPARQFAQARNTQRESNVNTILNGIGQNTVDYKGTFTCVTGNPIPAAPASSTIGTSGVDLTCLVPTYIPSSIPLDPDGGTPTNTGYTISASSSRYIICAPKHQETALAGSAPYCLTR